MIKHLPPLYKGIILAFTGFTAFAFCDACCKYLVQFYSLYQVIFIETSIAASIMLLFANRIGGRQGLFRRENIKINVLRGILNFVTGVMVTFCFQHVSLASVYIVLFTLPFMAAIMAIPLYKEKVSATRWIAIGIGFSGVLVAFLPSASGGFNIYLLITLGTSALIALLYIISRSLKEPTVFSLGFVPSIGSALLSAPLMISVFKFIQFEHMPVFILAGILNATGSICVSTAFRIAPASAVSPFLYTEIVWGILFGFLIFGDRPDGWMILGAAIVIASGIYLVETERRFSRLN